MHKVGEMTIGQIAKLILAVAVVIVLLMLVVRLFSPIFDRGDEIAKSYFESLEREIKLADSEEGGEFFMWYLGDSDREYYLVYFGETIRVDFYVGISRAGSSSGLLSESTTIMVPTNFPFNSLGRNSNRICVCSMVKKSIVDYESTCKYCEDLEHPVSFGSDETWYEKGGSRISIELDKLDGEKYVFARVK